jgi:hypothetical protein
MIRGLVTSHEASAPIGALLIAAFTDAANSGRVGPATAATQPLVGTTNRLGVSAAGTMVDIERSNIPQVTLGGPVSAGDPLTSNATSRAIRATAAGQRIIGFAEQPGVAGDIIDYRAAPGLFAGA